MKSSIRKINYLWPARYTVAMVLAFASLISGLSISPAFAARDDEHDRGARQGDHGQRAWHGNRENYGYRPQYRPEYRRPYYYEQPVYVPPPVYYQPRQSPGISLFLPLDLRR
jgi:hypothetical protein